MTSSSEPHKLVLRRERRSRATRPLKPQSGEPNSLRLLRPLDETRDHVRGGDSTGRVVSVVHYGDFLCPYCRRLHAVLARLRNATSETAAFVFRYFPNERAHPGAEFAARAVEAAAQQGRFWDMHDRLFEAEPPLAAADIISMARELGLDMDRFARDLDSESVRARVHRDLEDGRGNGVSGTPTLFIDGTRYDGAWDFYSILEGVRLPVAARVQRSARSFASLPASGGLVLVAAAVLAIVCANTWLAPYYQAAMSAPFGIGPPDSLLSMSVGEWFSEGLLAVFFLIVGLEIRREITAGILLDYRAAVLPVIAAVGGVVMPAMIYLSLNRGPTAAGWAVPTATDIAFALGVLALLGSRIPIALRVFVAALAVVDDILSVLMLAIFYPHNFQASWLLPAGFALLTLFALNRARVYASWPYLLVGAALWFSLHTAGVHAALSGIVLAMLLPARPSPAAAPLLAQAATALFALEQAEREIHKSNRPDRSIEQEPIWAWASTNLSAASDRLLSPADRFQRALSPWTAFFILPLFAFSAAGVALSVDFSAPGARGIFLGAVFGLVFGKPIGICLVTALATKLGFTQLPQDVSIRQFVGAACLCGIGDTVSLIIANQAFPAADYANIAKLGVLTGSVAAGIIGASVIAGTQNERAQTEAV